MLEMPPAEIRAEMVLGCDVHHSAVSLGAADGPGAGVFSVVLDDKAAAFIAAQDPA